MLSIQQGQCGTCVHFGVGEQRPDLPREEDRVLQVIQPCVHPSHVPMSLKVTPISGCADYVAPVAQA
ncbi:MAG: hypothetical protein ACFB9M_05295 [Myxococcota bacterium]